MIAWDDPLAKQALVTALVNDAVAIVKAPAHVGLDDEADDALGLLALVAGQDVEPGDGEGTWRVAQRVAPERVVSTVDPEARHTRKSPSQPRDGYKAHVAVEPETGLVTDAALTKANTSDAEVAADLLDDEHEGVEVLGDSAYGSGRLRAGLAGAGHHATIKPIPLRPPVPGGFDRDDFVVDHETNTATCPAGDTVVFGRGLRPNFAPSCGTCPLRPRCTSSAKGRTLSLNLYDIELDINDLLSPSSEGATQRRGLCGTPSSRRGRGRHGELPAMRDEIADRMRAAMRDGTVHEVMVITGEVAGSIDEILPAGDIVRRMARDAHVVIQGLYPNLGSARADSRRAAASATVVVGPPWTRATSLATRWS